MPSIRGLDGYLSEEGLVKKSRSPQKSVQGSTVAVDAMLWIKSRFDASQDPFFELLQTSPDSALLMEQVSQAVESDFAGMSPIFVFNGMRQTVAEGKEPMASFNTSTILEKYSHAWDVHDKNLYNSSATLFSEVLSFDTKFKHSLMKVFDALNLNYIQSGFSGYAQMGWLCQQEFAHAAIGSLDLLLFGVSKVILSFDHNSIEWVVLEDVLAAMELTFEQFIDACLLAGYGRCRTYDHIQEQGHFYFSTCIDSVKKSGSALAIFEKTSCKPSRNFHTVKNDIFHACVVDGSGITRLNPVEGVPAPLVSFSIPVLDLVNNAIVTPETLCSILSKSIASRIPLVPTGSLMRLRRDFTLGFKVQLLNVARSVLALESAEEYNYVHWQQSEVVSSKEGSRTSLSMQESFSSSVTRALSSIFENEITSLEDFTGFCSSVDMGIVALLIRYSFINGVKMDLLSMDGEQLTNKSKGTRGSRVLERVFSCMSGDFEGRPSRKELSPASRDVVGFQCLVEEVLSVLRLAVEVFAIAHVSDKSSRDQAEKLLNWVNCSSRFETGVWVSTDLPKASILDTWSSVNSLIIEEDRMERIDIDLLMASRDVTEILLN